MLVWPRFSCLQANVACESFSVILEWVFSVSCRTWSEFSLSSRCTSATFARTGRSANMWCLTTARSSVCRWGGLGREQCYCKTLNSSSQHRAAVLRAPAAHVWLVGISSSAQMTYGGPCEHGHGQWSSCSINDAPKERVLQFSPSWDEKLVVKLVVITCACAM